MGDTPQVRAPTRRHRAPWLVRTVLDLAERGNAPALGGASLHFLGLADEYVSAALTGLGAAGDPFALGLGQLTSARLARLANRNVDRLQLIDGVASVAIRYGDRTVLGQVWSARGDEYLAQGELGSAASCYAQALDILDGAQMRAHGVWALRALRRASAE